MLRYLAGLIESTLYTVTSQILYVINQNLGSVPIQYKGNVWKLLKPERPRSLIVDNELKHKWEEKLLHHRPNFFRLFTQSGPQAACWWILSKISA